MGESDRYIDRVRNKITLGDDRNALMALIAINAMVFISLGIIQVIYLMTQSTDSAFKYEILRFFILPARLDSLAVMPWTVLSYMFVHVGILYMLVTMLWLWAFGSIFQEVSDNNKIIPLYLYGGFVGAVVFVATNYLVPSLRDQIAYNANMGANASVMAIAVATTTLAPRYKLFRMLNGGIPLWVLTLIYIIIDLTGAGSLAHNLSHLAGGLMGYVFILSLRRGHDPGKWMNDFYVWFMNLFNPDKKNAPQQRIRDKVFYNTGNRAPFYKNPVITQQRIDQILDKINQKGLDYLSEEEKTILKKAGEEDF